VANISRIVREAEGSLQINKPSNKNANGHPKAIFQPFSVSQNALSKFQTTNPMMNEIDPVQNILIIVFLVPSAIGLLD
jgi:hypothetical protein